MIAVKTFDSTGIAPNGRLFAADLNAIQAAAAGLTDLTQAQSVGSLAIGEAGLILNRFGAGEAQISGAFRSSGILRGTGGVYIGQFTTTARNAIGAGLAPNGLIIFNTTTNQFEWNSGTDGARAWAPLGIDLTGDLVLTGTGGSLDFTAQAAANYFLTAKRSGDTVQRFAIKEDGTIEWGAGTVSARDAFLSRTGVGILALGAGNRLDLGSAGLRFTDGSTLTSAGITTTRSVNISTVNVDIAAPAAGSMQEIVNITTAGGNLRSIGAGTIVGQRLTIVHGVSGNTDLSHNLAGGTGATLKLRGSHDERMRQLDSWTFYWDGVNWIELNRNTQMSYGSSFPSGAIDGVEALITDSPSAPTYVWRFRYNASSSSAYKWEFMGGAPAFAAASPSADLNTMTSLGGGWWRHTGFTLPKNGDYRLSGSVSILNNDSQARRYGLACFQGATVGGFAMRGYAPGSSTAYTNLSSVANRIDGMTLSSLVGLAFYDDGQPVGANVLSWNLEVTPIRVN
jgi:hypothetical protein